MKNGAIQIKKINHYFIKNKQCELTKKVSNKKNRPYLIYYFDTLGNLIQKIGYGKHHNADLRLLDFVEANSYNENKLVKTITYLSDYENNINPLIKTEYFYNNKRQIITERELCAENDSLFMQLDYEYDSLGNKIKTIYNPTYYINRTYDNDYRITSLQQIYDNKVRWEYIFTYTDSTRVGNFKTYYNDGKNYTKEETEFYNNKKLIQTQKKYTSQDGLSEMRKIYYDELGVINKIEFYIAYSPENIFILEQYTNVKTLIKCKLTKKVIEEINYTLFED